MATAPTTEERQTVRAEAKWVRTSARKARVVLDHIRGQSVPTARTTLAFTPRAAARDIEKVLRSAVANAEANHGLDGDLLEVIAAYADEGPTLKRWRPRARGRVNRIRKRTCHITIVLAPAEGAVARRQVEQQEARRRRGLPRRRQAGAPAEAPVVAEAEGPEEIEALEAEAETAAAEALEEAVDEAPAAVEEETPEEAAAEQEPVAEAEPAAEPEEKPKRTTRKKTEETEG
jgi:large subunit ribosomal protein L22